MSEEVCKNMGTGVGDMQARVMVGDFKYLGLFRQTHLAEKQSARQGIRMLCCKIHLLRCRRSDKTEFFLTRKTQIDELEKKGALEESDSILGPHQKRLKEDLSKAGFRSVRKSSRCDSMTSNSNRKRAQ